LNRQPISIALVRGDVVLGTIEVKQEDANPPWQTGAFKPKPEFEAVRELFAQELQLLKDNTTDDAAKWDEWESVHAELYDPGLRLESLDKTWRAEEILIHIDGSDAWWRTD
jgi:hypothetical protein